MKRRRFIAHATIFSGALSFGLYSCRSMQTDVLNGVKSFLNEVANKDGSFRPGIDPNYKGTSDTGLSGIAAPAYATILSTTFGWELPYPDKTIEFFLKCQKSDGAFYAPTGSMDQNGPLAKLYNTTQSIVALRLLGRKPNYDPMSVVDFFFENGQFKDLPLYTTSFFPLFYSALGMPMPHNIDQKMRDYISIEQKEDGYLQNHVAATFHAAHYYRLIGQPTPKAKIMIEKVIKDQQQDGSWHLFEPDWDVHACFDALFILRQLADQDDPRIKEAYKNAIQWILSCRKPDGGFTHFPDWKNSDVDAVYFQVGGLVEAGYLKAVDGLKNEEILGWGHAMHHDKNYSCID
jgi:geranylgeranyl transferase type-2 subunit beta